MMADIPEFDPSKPFSTVPEFDPSKPFETEGRPLEEGERSVLGRAGAAASGTFQSGLEHAKKLFTPRTREEAEEGYGVTGALKGLGETAQGLLSPVTMGIGAPMSAAESLIASGMAGLARGVGRGAAAGIEQFSPEKAEEFRKLIPSSEEAYKTLQPQVGTAMLALGARPGFSALTTAESMPGELSRAIAREGDTPAAINQRLAEVQKIRPEATVADVAGEEVRGKMEKVAQTPGGARAKVIPFLEQRQKQQLQRLSDDLTEATGIDRQTAFREIQGAMGAREIESAPFYKQAYAEGNFPIWEQSPALQRLASAPDIQTAMRKAITGWRNEAVRDGFGSMNPPHVPKVGREAGNISFQGVTQIPVEPNLQFWDYTKRALDKMIDARTTPQGKQPATLVDLTRQLREALDGLGIESYAKGRNAWAGRSKYIDAIEDGRAIFDRKIPSEEFVAKFNALSDAEKEGNRIGIVGALLQKMRSNTAKLPDLTRELRSIDMREKLAAIMPTPEAAQRFERALDYEVKSSELAQRSLAGSPTYRRLMEKADAENIFGEAALHILAPHRSLHAIAFNLFKTFSRPVRNAIMSRADESLANLLTSKQGLPIPKGTPMRRLPTAAGLLGGASSVENPRGFKKGGRVTSTFRYETSGPVMIKRRQYGGPLGENSLLTQFFRANQPWQGGFGFGGRGGRGGSMPFAAPPVGAVPGGPSTAMSAPISPALGGPTAALGGVSPETPSPFISATGDTGAQPIAEAMIPPNNNLGDASAPQFDPGIFVGFHGAPFDPSVNFGLSGPPPSADSGDLFPAGFADIASPESIPAESFGYGGRLRRRQAGGPSGSPTNSYALDQQPQTAAVQPAVNPYNSVATGYAGPSSPDQPPPAQMTAPGPETLGFPSTVQRPPAAAPAGVAPAGVAPAGAAAPAAPIYPNYGAMQMQNWAPPRLPNWTPPPAAPQINVPPVPPISGMTAGAAPNQGFFPQALNYQSLYNLARNPYQAPMFPPLFRYRGGRARRRI